MPRLNGLDAIAVVRRRLAHTRVVVYTVDQDVDTAEEAMRRGASGFVTKAAPLSALLEVLRVVTAGGTQVVLR
jgi:DNA-binding NarL/FixJ family response regulator